MPSRCARVVVTTSRLPCTGAVIARRIFFMMNRTLLNRSPAELIAMATGRRGAAAYADAHRLVEKLV